MQSVWDPAFLQDQIRQFQSKAAAAMHPDVKAAYQGYAQHYEVLLEALRARGLAPTPDHA